VLWYRSS